MIQFAPAVFALTVDSSVTAPSFIDGFRTWSNIWGNSIGVLGFVLTIVGFCVTLWNLKKSRRAAEAAQQAADRTAAVLQHQDLIADLSACMAGLDEIKRLHRALAWHSLADRYVVLRQRLSRVEANGPNLEPEERATIARARAKFAEIAHQVEKAIAEPNAAPNPVKLNQIVSTQIDALDLVLLRAQRQLRDQR